jgi:hypothetical protein
VAMAIIILVVVVSGSVALGLYASRLTNILGKGAELFTFILLRIVGFLCITVYAVNRTFEPAP